MPAAKTRIRRYGFNRSTTNAVNPKPLSDLNITPLIDVLLVLLVMIMLSIPIALHKVEVDLPKPGLVTGKPKPINNLRLDAAGSLIWNGENIGDNELETRLNAMANDPDQPQLHMSTDAITRYERFDHVLAKIKKSGVQEMGFVGNERFAKWDADRF